MVQGNNQGSNSDPQAFASLCAKMGEGHSKGRLSSKLSPRGPSSMAGNRCTASGTVYDSTCEIPVIEYIPRVHFLGEFSDTGTG